MKKLFTLFFAFGAMSIMASTITEPEGAKSFPPPQDNQAVRESVKASAPTKGLMTEPENPARQPQGALSGKIVYTNGGHGWTSNGTSWFLQRGVQTPGIVEDLGNVDQLRIFAEYALRAGATVVPYRPVGHQLNEVVLDNDDPSVTFIPDNAWLVSGQTEFFGNAGDIPYRYAGASTTESAVARYTPTIPEAGFYPVYCWARDGDDRVADQLYRIRHTGGFTEMTINHRMVGKGWVYLGNYYFDAGTEGYVEISNRSTDTTPDRIIIADAIRFGNGMGDIATGAGISGYSREDEASVYWIEKMAGQGAPSSIWERFGSDDASDNVSSPTYMSAWMNREAEGDIYDRIYLSFHTNAFDPGSLGLYNGNNTSSSATPNQERWAEIIAAELNSDLVAIGSPPFENTWPDRVALGRSLTLDRSDIEFGEIRGDRNNYEMDATIIEVAAHGNQSEAEVLLDLKARRAVARGSVQAIIKYMEEFDTDGGNLTMPPDTPQNVWSERTDAETMTLHWEAPPANEIVGDPAESYVIYQSPDGFGFADPIFSVESNYNLAWPNDTRYFRVAARNAGGESPPSEVIAVRKSTSASEFLIVNGFDRVDRLQNPADENQSGAFRIYERQINSQDYAVQHAKAIASAGGYGFVTTSNEAVSAGDVSLSDYPIVFWISGEERTVADTKTFDEALSLQERQAISSYLAGGGKLFISGSEIGFDLFAQRVDSDFYNNVLRVNYGGTNSNSRQLQGADFLSGFSADYLQNDRIYDAAVTDVLSPNSGAVTILNYNQNQAAGIKYSSGEERLIYLGLPFETINSETERAELMAPSIEFLLGQKDRWLLY